MRDSLEDYEYLYLLAGGRPAIDVVNTADVQADKMISGLTSYTRDSTFMYNLRRLIGLKNGGEIAAIPDIQPPITHPRAEGPPGNYYINFQDPAGDPATDPLIVNDNTYMKIGWNEYEADTSLGYGWYGDMAHVKYQYLGSGPNVLQRSIIYDDWGRQKTFEFDLPNGVYEVTVSVGWEGRTYSHHKINIEGISFINDEATTPSTPYLVRTQRVTIADNKLTMAMGIFDEYTMLNYLDIEAAEPTANFSADVTSGEAPLTVQFTDLSSNGPASWEWDFDNDGTVDATDQHPTHTYQEMGTYTVRLHVSNEKGSDDEVKVNYITAWLPAVTTLRVVHAITGNDTLTATLRWTPLPQAITTTLRYADVFITDANWSAAHILTDALPGTANGFTAYVPYPVSVALPYAGGTRYFALKSQDASGRWLGLSNVTFWPNFSIYLPLILR
ncbi:MAG: PKD domain-containing protein [Anaerolineae bacterium]|nr:PKD domain-containing protein [Anaerolineae bacterium]